MSLDHRNVTKLAAPPETVEPALLRTVAGTFATGVTIVTCSEGGSAHGCAANAVLSVSLEPALMLISLAQASRTRVAVERAGAFAINILPDSAEGIELCSLFASRAEDKFGRVPHRSGRFGAPVLEDALAWLECSVETIQVAGDHTLFVGRVTDAGHAVGEPLVFFRGRHRRLAV